MGKGNTAMRRWLSDKDRFADLFNATIFEGNNVVQAKDLEVLDSEMDLLLTDKLEKAKEVNRYRDIVMLWKKGMAFAVLGCENQAKMHHAMPVRNMVYDGLNYAEQIKQHKKNYEKNSKEKMSSDEFLSGLRREDKIYPVITIVFYYGKDIWNTNRSLYEMFPQEILKEKKNLLEKFVPNYWINLVDAGNVEDIPLFRTDLQEILGMLKYRKNKAELVKYIREKEAYFRNVDEETYHAIREFLHSEKILKREVRKHMGKEKIDMCQALEELYNDGVNEGISQGISQGIMLGEENHLLKQMKAKISKGMKLEEIAEVLEESIETITELMKKI